MRAARRAYYARAYYVRRRRRAAATLGLALSTNLGGPNVAGSGVPAQPGIPVPPNNVVIVTPDAAYSDVPNYPQGDRITIRIEDLRLWAVPRYIATGTLGNNALVSGF